MMPTLFPPILAETALPSSAVWNWDASPHAWGVVAVYLGLLLAGLGADAFLVVRLWVAPPDWRRHISRLQWRPVDMKLVSQLFFTLFALFALVNASQGLWQAWTGRSPAGHPVLWVVLQSVTFHWTGLLLLGVLLARRRISWRSAFGLDKRDWKRLFLLGVLFYLATMPFLWFYSALYQLALKVLGVEPTWQDVAITLSSDQPLLVRLYLLSLAMVVAPLFEELFFRGLGLPLLAFRVGMGPAVAVISLLFAGIHLHLASLVPLFLISVAFSLAYLYSESILVPVVMHGLFNGVNVGLMILLRQ